MINTSLINNPEYDDHKANWELVEDCVAGSWKIKKEKTKYLPIPNPDENTTTVNNPRVMISTC